MPTAQVPILLHGSHAPCKIHLFGFNSCHQIFTEYLLWIIKTLWSRCWGTVIKNTGFLSLQSLPSSGETDNEQVSKARNRRSGVERNEATKRAGENQVGGV